MPPVSTRTTRSPSVKRSILVKAPLEETWQVFADEEKLRMWYFDDLVVDLRDGGVISFEGPEGQVAADVESVQPPRRLVLSYNAPWWGVVTWDLVEAGSGGSTRVHVTHAGFEGREEWMDRFAWGWEDFLKGLKAVAEGRTPK